MNPLIFFLSHSLGARGNRVPRESAALACLAMTGLGVQPAQPPQVLQMTRETAPK